MIRLFAAFFFLAAFSLPAAAATGTAIFAGGCFWCVESDFDHVPGVTSTVSGYIGGSAQNPSYEDHEGFREAVEIKFDTSKTSYDKLLDVFWRSIDPTDGGGQFCDRGPSYTTAIYALDEEQLKKAKASKAKVQGELGQTVATVVKPAPKFWPAEDYHQNFYRTHPQRYQYYRSACGRDRQIQAIWGDQAHQGIMTH
jgi:peptide-methionine (S)-S-oxide reductase